MGFIDGALALVADYLWKVSWQAGALALVVWVVTKLAKKAPARFRHTLWALVLIKFLIPPFAQLPAGVAFWRHHEAVKPAVVIINNAADYPETSVAHAPLAPATRQNKTATAPLATPNSTAPTRPHVDYGRIWLSLWFAGVGISLLVLAIQSHRQKKLIERANSTGPALVKRLYDAARKMGVRRLPYISYSDEISTPMLVSLLWPTILLPKELDSCCKDSDLDAMLLHELAHIKRKDMAVLWLYQIVRAVFFFHPALWLTGLELKKERELACDELVILRSGIERSNYASGYVSALKLANAASRVPVSIAMAEPFEVEKMRLEGILHMPIRRFTPMWLLVLVATVIVGIPTFAGLASPPNATINRIETSKHGKIFHYKEPAEWNHGAISLKTVSIGKINNWPPMTGLKGKRMEVFLYLENKKERLLTDSQRNHWFVDATAQIKGGKGLKFGFSTQDQSTNKYSFQFSMPPKGTKSIILSGELSSNAISAEKDYGQYNLDELMSPMVLIPENLAVVVSGWSIIDTREEYIGDVGGYVNDIPDHPSNFPMLKDRLAIWTYSTRTDTHNALNFEKIICDSPQVSRMTAYDASGKAVELIKANTDDMDFPERGYIGMEITDINKSIIVTNIDLLGPAYTAGVRFKDKIVEFPGKGKISNSVLYDSTLKPVHLIIKRDGKIQKLTINPVPYPVWPHDKAICDTLRSSLWSSIGSTSSHDITKSRFLSITAVPKDFQPVKVRIMISTITKKSKKIPFEMEVPIPKEFWETSGTNTQPLKQPSR